MQNRSRFGSDRKRLMDGLSDFLKMAKDRKLQMPSSTAGITRYFDDYKSKLASAPELVIVFAIFVVIIVILLNVYGGGIFGI